MTEFVMMGLRLSEGISLSRLAEISPKPLPAHKLTELRQLGLIWRDGDLIGATTEGRLVLNGVISELLTN